MAAEDTSGAGAAVASGTTAPVLAPGASGPAASGVRTPDFFVVGHEKCGTSALHEMLNRHPGAFMPKCKEPRFFAPEFDVCVSGLRELHITDLDEYLALFAEAVPGQLCGEASPQYIRSPTAAARIAEMNPDARIIAIMREPASLLRSMHVQNIQGGRETEKDFAKALGLEPARREGRHIPRGFSSPAWLLYSDHVRFVEQLETFRAHFPAERTLVLIYDDYRRDNAGTLRTILRFLELNEDVSIQPVERMRTVNTARFMPLHAINLSLRQARHRPEQAGWAARAANSLTPKRLRLLYKRVAFTEAAAPDQQLTLELRRRFKPEVQALSEYLGRDLVALWGYEDL
jgi:hypothetical protein